MPGQTKTCRVCGAKYEACKSIRTGSKTFNWREVACSPECGEKYLQMVEQARKHDEPQKMTEKAERGSRRRAPVFDEHAVDTGLSCVEADQDDQDAVLA